MLMMKLLIIGKNNFQKKLKVFDNLKTYKECETDTSFVPELLQNFFSLSLLTYKKCDTKNNIWGTFLDGHVSYLLSFANFSSINVQFCIMVISRGIECMHIKLMLQSLLLVLSLLA